MMYGYLKTKCNIGNPNVEDTISLHGSPILSLLLVNRQIHDEYLDTALGSAILSVYKGDHTKPDFQPNFSPKLLKRIRSIDIDSSWVAAFMVAKDDAMQWAAQLLELPTQGPDNQVSRIRTPSNGMLFTNVCSCTPMADYICSIVRMDNELPLQHRAILRRRCAGDT